MSTTAISKKQELQTMLEKQMPSFDRALPRGLDAERFIQSLYSELRKTPDLQGCDPGTVILAGLQAAQLGLEFGGVLGQAYLVPYKGAATLQIGYRGFIELARRSGAVSAISAECVYERDSFGITLGTKREITHVPAQGKRGNVIGAYAVVRFKDGYQDFEFMDIEQIEKCRKSSKARDNGPWVSHYEEMCRKTPIRRLGKRLPLSPEDSSLIRAAVLDEYEDTETVAPGTIELDPGSPLAALPAAAGNGGANGQGQAKEPEPTPEPPAEDDWGPLPTTTYQSRVTDPKDARVTLEVGPQTTKLVGATVPFADKLREFGAVLSKDRTHWTFDSGKLPEFLDYFEKKKIAWCELTPQTAQRSML